MGMRFYIKDFIHQLKESMRNEKWMLYIILLIICYYGLSTTFSSIFCISFTYWTYWYCPLTLTPIYFLLPRNNDFIKNHLLSLSFLRSIWNVLLYGIMTLLCYFQSNHDFIPMNTSDYLVCIGFIQSISCIDSKELSYKAPFWIKATHNLLMFLPIILFGIDWIYLEHLESTSPPILLTTILPCLFLVITILFIPCRLKFISRAINYWDIPDFH